jgi:hypothetical protein
VDDVHDVDGTDATAPAGSSGSRSLVLIAAGIVALMATTIAVVLVVGGPRSPSLEPGSPEAALHAYLTAFEAGDLAQAHAHFSGAVREQWDLDAYRRSVDAYGAPLPDDDRARRVLFDHSDVTGDSAQVHVVVEEFVSDGLRGDTYRFRRSVRMVREDGAWRLDQALVWLEPVPVDLR